MTPSHHSKRFLHRIQFAARDTAQSDRAAKHAAAPVGIHWNLLSGGAAPAAANPPSTRWRKWLRRYSLACVLRETYALPNCIKDEITTFAAASR